MNKHYYLTVGIYKEMYGFTKICQTQKALQQYMFQKLVIYLRLGIINVDKCKQFYECLIQRN